VLRGVQEPPLGFGYAAGLQLHQDSAAKTGTIDDNKAVWFVGYTPNLATASMIAGANGRGHWLSLNGQTVGGVYITSAHGSTTAGPMWGDAMHVIEQWLPDVPFTRPDPSAIQGQLVTVPSVYGYSPSQAADVLRKAGFNPVIGTMVNSSSPYGTVAYLSPGSGTQLGSGSTVTIYVSNGHPYVAPQPQQPRNTGGGGGTTKPGKGHKHG